MVEEEEEVREEGKLEDDKEEREVEGKYTYLPLK